MTLTFKIPILHSKGKYQQNEKASYRMGKKYFQIIYLIRGQYRKYIKKSHNQLTSETPQTIQFKNGQN